VLQVELIINAFPLEPHNANDGRPGDGGAHGSTTEGAVLDTQTDHITVVALSDTVNLQVLLEVASSTDKFKRQFRAPEVFPLVGAEEILTTAFDVLVGGITSTTTAHSGTAIKAAIIEPIKRFMSSPFRFQPVHKWSP